MTSSLKFKKQSEAIRMLGKHTTFAGYNKDCEYGLLKFRDNPLLLYLQPHPFLSFLSPYTLHPFTSFPPFCCIISNPFRLFILSLLILSHLLTQFHFTKHTHKFTVHLLFFRWHSFKHSFHLCMHIKTTHFHGKYVWKKATTTNQPIIWSKPFLES